MVHESNVGLRIEVNLQNETNIEITSKGQNQSDTQKLTCIQVYLAQTEKCDVSVVKKKIRELDTTILAF